MTDRRPTFLVLLLGFSLFALVAGREAAFRQETRDQARALSRALSRPGRGPKLEAADLAALAEPMQMDSAELAFNNGTLLAWQRPGHSINPWPLLRMQVPVTLPGGPAMLTVKRPSTHWWWHLAWAALLGAFAVSLRFLQRSWGEERRLQAERLAAESSGKAGALQQLQKRLSAEKHLSGLMQRLRAAGPGTMDQALNEVLRDLGQAAGADRAVLFLGFDNGRRFGVTHGWSAPGVRESGLEGMESLPTEAFPWLDQRMAGDQPLMVADMDDLPPEAAAERYLLQMRGARSMLLAPLKVRGQRLGFAGYARVREARAFSSGDAELLSAACDAMAEFIVRARGELRSERLAELERLSGTMANRFLEAEEAGAVGVLEEALEQLRRYANADRAGLWVLHGDGTRVRLAGEAQRPGAPPTAERDRELAAAAQPGLLDQLRAAQSWVTGPVERLGMDWEPERLELRRRGVAGALMSGLFVGGHMLGWLELDRLGALPLSEDALLAAGAVAPILASALRRERAEAALKASEDRARMLLSGVPDALLRLNAEGRILDARLPRGERLMSGELIGSQLELLPQHLKGLAAEAVPTLRQALALALRSGRPQTVDLDMDSAPGPRYLECRLLPQDGNEAMAVVRDVTQERRQDQEHERQLGNLLAIFNAGSRGLMLLGLDGRVQAFNLAMAENVVQDMGVRLQPGMDFAALLHPEALPTMKALFLRAVKGEEPVDEREFRLPNGSARLVRVQFLPVFDESGDVRAVCMSLEFLDRLQEAQDALRVSEQRYALAALGSKDGLWDLDLGSGALYTSPRLLAQLGLETAEGPQDLDAWVALAHADDRKAFRGRLQAHLEGRTDHFEVELRMRHAALADPVWMLLRGMAVRDEQGKPVRVAGSQSDINLRKLTEESLLRDALQDPLTGLPNRALVVDRLGRCQARAKRRKGYSYALLYLDTDDFKTVNQSLGHLAGDQLLKELAGRLEGCLRPGDTVGRLGGDEFAVILDDLTNVKDAEIVADRVLEACQKPFLVLGRQIYPSVSVGIALSNAEAVQPGELLRDAETAMVQAKASGRSRWRLFEPGMLQAAVSRLDLHSGLRQALEQGEFRLHYQPIVHIGDGRLAGVEALARWAHPTRGMIMPGDFIPAAEESGLILPLGRLVLREAIMQLADWRATGAPDPLTMSINLSPRQLEDPELLRDARQALEQSGVPAARVTLEVTESVFMSNRQLASHTLSALHDLGFQIAIDDFGTGYSSLSYLHQFPAQVLKIDRSFVSRMDGLPENEAVTSAVITLGHKLGLKLVAEGIETELQAQRLRALGCGLGQGYWYARPMPAEDLPAYWAKAFTVPSLP